MSSIQSRITPADSGLILGALAFAIYLIQWQHLAIIAAIGTAAGAVTLFTAVVVMPKAVQQFASQMTALNNLLTSIQAPASGTAGGVTPGAVPLPTLAFDNAQVIEGKSTPDEQVRQ